MRRISIVLAVVGIVTHGLAWAQDLDEILTRHYAALGGLEKLKSVHSVRLTGLMTVAPKQVAELLWEWKRPNKVRTELILSGLVTIQAFDGSVAWEEDPRAPNPAPKRLPAEEMQLVRLQADFDGPLIEAKQKGNTIKLAGTQAVNGRDCFELTISLGEGGTMVVFIDTKTYLIAQTKTTVKIGEAERRTESVYSDYRSVDGVMLAHYHENTIWGLPYQPTLRVEFFELNGKIDNSRFAMPGLEKADNQDSLG